jgi:hypothetical protein
MKIVNFVLKSDFRFSGVIILVVLFWNCGGPNSNSNSSLKCDTCEAVCTNPNPRVVMHTEDSTWKVITVLDINRDTICLNGKFKFDSLGLSMFKGKDTLIISFKEYMKMEPHIKQDDMSSISDCNGIIHLGQLGMVKREYRKRGMNKAKNDFVSNINWANVSAVDISCKPVLWGIVYSDEFFGAYQKAVGRKYSWAEFEWDWDKEHSHLKVSKDYLRQAQDSLFKKDDRVDSYTLTWNKEYETSFRIVDLNMVMDLSLIHI